MTIGADAMKSMTILAGGDNTRMEALRGTIYKAFLPIHGMSIIARHILRAGAFGIEVVHIVVDEYDPALPLLAGPAPNGPAVEIHTRGGSQADKILSRHEADPAGRMLVVLGDSLAPVDLRELWQRAGTPGLDSAVALAEMRLPYGVALVDGDRVASFHEKPATGILINTGYMVLGSRAIDYLRAGKSLSQCLECLAAGRQLGGWLCSGVLTSVNSVEELGSAHSRFLGEP